LPLLASKRHTISVVAIILIAFAMTGYFVIAPQSTPAIEHFGRSRIYALGIVSEWLLVAYVISGLQPRGAHVIKSIIDPTQLTGRRWIRYGLVALAAFVIWGVFGVLLGKTGLLRPAPEDIRHLMVFLPGEPVERGLWVGLSLTAGFCEEFVYRGYLLRQFQTLTGRLSIAIVLQAILYAAAHAALPWQIMVIVGFLGVLFGSVAAMQRSLIPGMLLHVAMDILPGFAPQH
jgi:uncharacterized protein